MISARIWTHPLFPLPFFLCEDYSQLHLNVQATCNKVWPVLHWKMLEFPKEVDCSLWLSWSTRSHCLFSYCSPHDDSILHRNVECRSVHCRHENFLAGMGRSPSWGVLYLYYLCNCKIHFVYTIILLSCVCVQIYIHVPVDMDHIPLLYAITI